MRSGPCAVLAAKAAGPARLRGSSLVVCRLQLIAVLTCSAFVFPQL